jgi:hypothetical protein
MLRHDRFQLQALFNLLHGHTSVIADQQESGAHHLHSHHVLDYAFHEDGRAAAVLNPSQAEIKFQPKAVLIPANGL